MPNLYISGSYPDICFILISDIESMLMYCMQSNSVLLRDEGVELGLIVGDRGQSHALEILHLRYSKVAHANIAHHPLLPELG